MSRVILFLVAVMATVLSACDKPTAVPATFVTVPDSEWHYGRALEFNAAGDTLGRIDAVAVSVRHTNDYPYSNLWLELAYNSGDSLVADTFNLHLADEYGKWLGAGSGPVVMLTDTVRPRRSPDIDTRFVVRHIMRIDVLPEVEQVGLTFITDSLQANYNAY